MCLNRLLVEVENNYGLFTNLLLNKANVVIYPALKNNYTNYKQC